MFGVSSPTKLNPTGLSTSSRIYSTKHWKNIGFINGSEGKGMIELCFRLKYGKDVTLEGSQRDAETRWRDQMDDNFFIVPVSLPNTPFIYIPKK